MLEKIRKFIENNKFFIPLMGISGTLLIVFSIGAFIVNDRYKALSVRYDQSLNEFNQANDKLYAENMAAFEEILLGSFSEKQLIRIAKKNINYGISINGKPLGKNDNIVYSERPTVAVLLSENYGKDALNYLPRNVLEKGSMIALANAPFLVEVTHGERKMENNFYDFYYGKTLSYVVSDLEAGDIITIKILPEIALVMGMVDNIVEIIYNKEYVEES